MKKATLFLPFIFITLLILSCNKDDDIKVLSSINGTSWVGTGDTSSRRTITFTSELDYNYLDSEYGDNIHGTYIFSNVRGVLTDRYGTTGFYINNELLTIDYDTGTGEYIEDTGIETFLKK